MVKKRTGAFGGNGKNFLDQEENRILNVKNRYMSKITPEQEADKLIKDNIFIKGFYANLGHRERINLALDKVKAIIKGIELCCNEVYERSCSIKVYTHYKEIERILTDKLRSVTIY